MGPENLRVPPPQFVPHPDAKEPTTTQVTIEIKRPKPKMSLGLRLDHFPPLEHQKTCPGEQSSLIVKEVLKEGFVHTYNSAQTDPMMCIHEGDRILAVVDASKPKNKAIGGDSQTILKIIQSGCNPVVFIIGRILGPPLRFKVGQQVKAQCGQRGWLDGTVVNVWVEHDEIVGHHVPYVIKIEETGDYVFSPKDSDDCVVKGPPRFAVGDEGVCSRDVGWTKCRVEEVRDEGLKTMYKVQVIEGSTEGDMVCVPEDTNRFMRRIARFKKGDKVMANVGQQFSPGTVEVVYHPEWVYKIHLDCGEDVYAPEDSDGYVRQHDIAAALQD